MEGGEKDVFPSHPKGHQAWNLPLATKQNVSPLTMKLGTFHWPPNQMFPD